MIELAAFQFHDQAGKPDIVTTGRGGEKAQTVKLHRQHTGLKLHQPVAHHRLLHQGLAIDRFGIHQFDDGAEAAAGRIGIAQHAAFMLQRGIGNEPARATPAHHIFLRHADIGEKHLVEFGVAGHGLEGAHLDPRRAHRKQDVGNALMLGALSLGAHKAEDHVGILGGGGPDFLAVDDEIMAVFHGAGLQRGQIGAGAGLGIALTPDNFAAQGGRNILALLFLAADLEQCWHQHRNALPRQAGRRAGTGEFLRDDAGFEHIRLGAIAAILPRNGARGIAVLDQKALPGEQFRPRTVAPAPAGRKTVAVRHQKGARLGTEGFIFCAVSQIHGCNPPEAARLARVFAPRKPQEQRQSNTGLWRRRGGSLRNGGRQGKNRS